MKKALIAFALLIVALIATFLIVGPERLMKLASTGAETQMIEMRDGSKLATDIYRPIFGASFGTVYIATPYNRKNLASVAAPMNLMGLAVAIQDDRGKHGSEGQWDGNASQPNDLWDTLDYISSREWSNGRVGMIGCSYPGQGALFAAQLGHPALKTVIAEAAGGAHGSHKGRYRYGGANHATTTWTGPVVQYLAMMGALSASPNEEPDEEPIIALLARRPELRGFLTDLGAPYDAHDPLWQTYLDKIEDAQWFEAQRPWINGETQVHVPILHVNSWDDYAVSETLLQRALFAKNGVDETVRNNQIAIISPTSHCKSSSVSSETIVGDRNLGDASFSFEFEYVSWFRHWLNDAPEEDYDAANIRFFEMGAETWREAVSWPPTGAEEKTFFLQSTGKAQSRNGDGSLATKPSASGAKDDFLFDPKNPVPTMGGANLVGRQGFLDQSEVQDRTDVLVYTTAPIKKPFTIAGPMTASLYVSTTARDASFHVKAVVVAPDGTPYNLQQGGVRLSKRDGPASPARVVPGEVYEVQVDLQATANHFVKGSMLQLEISGSDYPRSPLNYGLPGVLTKPEKGEISPYTSTVHHGTEKPSALRVFAFEG